jgi:hypothetical protein
MNTDMVLNIITIMSTFGYFKNGELGGGAIN